MHGSGDCSVEDRKGPVASVVETRAGPSPDAMNKLLTLAACTLRSGQYQNKAIDPGRKPKTFWHHPPLHPHITYGDRFSISAIKDKGHCKRVHVGSVEELICCLTRLQSFKLLLKAAREMARHIPYGHLISRPCAAASIPPIKGYIIPPARTQASPVTTTHFAPQRNR